MDIDPAPTPWGYDDTKMNAEEKLLAEKRLAALEEEAREYAGKRVDGAHGIGPDGKCETCDGGPGANESEWQKFKPVGETEPQTQVTVTVDNGDFTVDVSISVPKGTWEAKHLIERANRAANEALQPLVAQ